MNKRTEIHSAILACNIIHWYYLFCQRNRFYLEFFGGIDDIICVLDQYAAV